MPGKGTTIIPDSTKRAAFALRLKGHSNLEVAKRLGLHPVTISRICSAIRKAGPPDAGRKQETAAENEQTQEQARSHEEADSLLNWRETLKRRSIEAVNRGLLDSTDSYKSAAIGTTVLKGLGEFAPDSATVVAMFGTIPKELRSEYEVEGAPQLEESEK